MSRRPAVALLAALALLAACGNDTTRADQARDAAKSAGLSDEVADFFALATRGPDATYRVSYTTPAQDGTPVQVTISQRPPDRRIDFFPSDGSVDSTIATGGKRHRCTKSADVWQCGELSGAAEAPGDAFDPNVVQATISRLQQRADDYDFRIDSRRIAGTDGRCLVTTIKPEKSSDQTLGASGILCLAPDGAQLLVDTPKGKLEATEYSTEVPADAFTLPVEPQPSSTQAPSG